MFREQLLQVIFLFSSRKCCIMGCLSPQTEFSKVSSQSYLTYLLVQGNICWLILHERYAVLPDIVVDGDLKKPILQSTSLAGECVSI